MAHQVKFLRSGTPDESRRLHALAAHRFVAAHPLMSLLVIVLAFVPGLSAPAQATSSYVPAVVVSSVSAVPVPTLTKDELTGTLTNVVQPSEVMLDGCGNIYTLDYQFNNGGSGTTVTEIPANGGPATVVENVGQYYPGHLGQDPTRTNLIAGQAYGTGGNLIPLVNCVPQPSNAHHVGGGSGALFYYYNPGYFAGDFLGNTYISTQSTCCVTGQYYLVQESSGNGNILLTNQPKEIQSLAIDKNQNVYFITGGSVFELPNSGGTGGTYPTSAVPFGSGYSAPVGLSVDVAGNLYVADEGAGAIFEIPYETTASGSALNLADQFTVAAGVTTAVPVAVDGRGDLYFTPPNATAVEKLSLGNANFGQVAIGQTATRTLNFQFNAAVTPAAVQLPTGVFGTKSGGNGSVPCTAGTSYVPVVPSPNPSNQTNYCTVIVTFTPTAIGKQSSAVVLADAQGNALATAYIEGVGQGASVTVDPGTMAPTGSGLKSPAQVALDGAGNTFIADPGANAVVEFPAGGAAPVSLTATVTKPGVGSDGTALYTALTVSAPTGVAVDGAGDVFVADTGNNRVIEIPVVNGALSTANAKFIADGFSAPASVFIHTNGDLYVTDTGNNTVYRYASFATGYATPTALATGLNAPLAATVDGAGNIFIANSGDGTILEIPLGGGLETVDAGILNPSALATDSSGSLFIVDQGNFRVLRIPSVGGVLSTNSPAEVALGVANPYGVTLDAAANLYVTDNTNAAAYIINRSQVDLSFGDLAMGTTSQRLPLTVESAGNLPVIFNTPYFAATGDTGDFAMTSSTGACGDGITLVSGGTCDLSATFTPTATGARAETIAFSSNSGTPAQAMLSGSGITLGTTTAKLALTAPSSGSPFYGEPLVFAATVSGTGTPSGSVSFIVDGVQVALLPLTAGVATLPLNSGLTGGVHSVYAVYKGDSANDGSSAAPLSITIARAPTTSVIAVTKVAYNNPFSLRHSNAGSCSILDQNGFTAAFPAIVSDGVAFTGTVTSPGVGIPSGTLTFYADGVLLNSNSATPKTAPPSIVSLAPTSGGFAGSTTSDADTLGDGATLGENNVLVGPHQITVAYSGDQNYLPSTSVGVLITVVDVSPTTPIVLPQQPSGTAPYCTPGSPIAVSEPAIPATYQVQTSAGTVMATSTVPGTVQLTISSLGGWNGFVDIACPDMPKYVTCTSNPGQGLVKPSKPNPAVLPTVVTLTITTNVPPNVPTANQSRFLWLPALLLGLVTLSSRRRLKRARITLTVFGVALLLIGGLTGLSGCGSGSSGSSSAVTPAGSYQVHLVMQGSQLNTSGYNGLDFQPDLPYSVPLTLVVK